MQRHTLKDIVRIYEKLKKLANRAFFKENYEEGLQRIAAAANVAYNFNWIYVDLDLEEMLSEISSKIITKKNYIPKKGRIVFYDVYALDSKGLTQQYINAIISWDVELLFILEGNDILNSKNIINTLEKYPKAEFFTIDSKLAQIEKIQILYNKIVNFQPEKAFLHLSPSSVTAVCLWNSLSQTTRYQINLTDHAFWLGISCIDYNIEFRDYGYSVSLEKRGIKKEQLLLQPYYPITECSSFQGFPSQVTPESIVIFTGGAFYKMYGDDDSFFKIMKKLLSISPKVLILIAGRGDDKPLQDFIKKNKLQERLIIIGSRKDINYVFENSDIYLSTYPITGGLMSQFAAVNSKPVLAYTSSDIKCNYIEGLLNWGDTNELKMTYTDLKSFFEEAKKLILDTEYRLEKGKEIKSHVIAPEQFNSYLGKLVKTNKNYTEPKMEDIDYEKFTLLYLDVENNYLSSLNENIIKHLKLSTFFLFPIIGIKSLFSKKIVNMVINKLKK